MSVNRSDYITDAELRAELSAADYATFCIFILGQGCPVVEGEISAYYSWDVARFRRNLAVLKRKKRKLEIEEAIDGPTRKARK